MLSINMYFIFYFLILDLLIWWEFNFKYVRGMLSISMYFLDLLIRWEFNYKCVRGVLSINMYFLIDRAVDPIAI